jgi:hypothetical protein
MTRSRQLAWIALAILILTGISSAQGPRCGIHCGTERWTVKIFSDRARRPITIEVVGVGFFDFDHSQTGRAPNNIELHPVLSLTQVQREKRRTP